MPFAVIGVHPINSIQLGYLLEIEWQSELGVYDWDEVTQEVENMPRKTWQAVYDEQPLGNHRWVCFFHYLDFNKPLLTPDGPIDLPEPSPLPSHLRHIEYVEVD